MLKLSIVLIIFILGLYFIMFGREKLNLEGFGNLQDRCPNILIQKGTELVLFNSKKAKIPGVNPLKFDNLEEYVEFTKWQRSQGIRCPVLYLQHSYDTQGKPVYKARPSPTNLNGGYPDLLLTNQPRQGTLTDAGSDNVLFNKGYPSFDSHNQYIGVETPLDTMFQENSMESVNPMDPNWGGRDYTKAAVKAGEFKGDEVKIYIPN